MEVFTLLIFKNVTFNLGISYIMGIWGRDHITEIPNSGKNIMQMFLYEYVLGYKAFVSSQMPLVTSFPGNRTRERGSNLLKALQLVGCKVRT